MQFEEKTIKSERIYNGKIINLRKDGVILPDGAERQREVIEHPGGAAVVAVKKDGNLLLVRQWRYPFSETLLEIPAGKLSPGEPPEACAARELEEETGYAPGKLTKLAALKTSPGFCDEVIHLFLAEDLILKKPRPDEDEFLEIVEIPLDDALRMAREGKLSDAKTIAGILLAEKR